MFFIRWNYFHNKKKNRKKINYGEEKRYDDKKNAIRVVWIDWNRSNWNSKNKKDSDSNLYFFLGKTKLICFCTQEKL